MTTNSESHSNSSSGASPSGSRPDRVKTPAERVTPPVVYRLPGMDSVQVRANLKYTDVGDPNLLMDVYTPPGLAPEERLPIVVFLHGNAGPQYRPKDWGFYKSWGRLIAAAGMVAVAFTHRLGYPETLLAEAGADAESALQYVRGNASFWNGDAQRIALFAWSGGSPLLSAAMREKPPYVRCLLAFYAILDCRPSPMFQAQEQPETVRAFSPLACLEAQKSFDIPMFLARAGQDEIPTLNDSLARFVAAALATNLPITLMNHPTGEHGFDNQNDDARSREIISAALAFLRTHLQIAGG